MYISQVRLSNIRGFHDARDVDLTLTRPNGTHAGWTVLAGRNGSGKTTLLRAIALVLGGLDAALSLVPDIDTWASVGKDIATADLRLVSSTHGGRPIPQSYNGAGLFRSDLLWHQPPPGSRRWTVVGSAGEDRTDWFCAGYGPFRRLVGGSSDTMRLMSGPAPVARLASLFHEDASLAEGVSWLIEQRLRSYENKPGAEELIAAALAILADGLLPDGYQVDQVDSDGLWIVSDGNRFPLREMSDGYRTVTALVVDLIKQIYRAYGELWTEQRDGKLVITAPGVVIIDEVDAHLHVSWQKRIGGWLKSHFPAIQFIVSTHSPYICQAADEGGLIRLPGPDEQEPPRVVDPDLYRRIVFGSGDDAVLSDLFGLDTPYSPQAQAMRAELVQLETDVLTGRASEQQIARYRELKAQLTSSTSARVYEIAAQLGRPEPTDA